MLGEKSVNLASEQCEAPMPKARSSVDPVLKKVDNYMRVKTGGRTPGLTSPVMGSAPFNFNPATPTSADSRGPLYAPKVTSPRSNP